MDQVGSFQLPDIFRYFVGVETEYGGNFLCGAGSALEHGEDGLFVGLGRRGKIGAKLCNDFGLRSENIHELLQLFLWHGMNKPFRWWAHGGIQLDSIRVDRLG